MRRPFGAFLKFLHRAENAAPHLVLELALFLDVLAPLLLAQIVRHANEALVHRRLTHR